MYVLCTRNAEEPLPLELHMRKGFGRQQLSCSGTEEPEARIIGAYCEYLSAPEQHVAILERRLARSGTFGVTFSSLTLLGPKAPGRQHQDHQPVCW